MSDSLAVKDRINKIILSEEFGIADEVEEKSQFIYDEIEKLIKGYSKKIEKKCDFDFPNFYVHVDKTKITVYPKFYYFEAENEQGRIGGFVGQGLNWIFIPVISINGHINYCELFDTIQHEMQHAFQTAKAGKDFGGEMLYAYATSRLYYGDNFERNVARLIYCSTKNEQEALINGAYAYIKSNKDRLIDDVIKETEAYSGLQNLYDSYNFVKNNLESQEMAKVLRSYAQYKVNSTNILKIGKQAIDSFEGRFARLVHKCEKNGLTEMHYYPNIKNIPKINNERALYLLK